jgi:hypothetical protein
MRTLKSKLPAAVCSLCNAGWSTELASAVAMSGSERAAVREPAPPLVDDLVGAVGLVDIDDIDLFALLERDAALRFDLAGRAAIVEARQRAPVRLGPA